MNKAPLRGPNDPEPILPQNWQQQASEQAKELLEPSKKAAQEMEKLGLEPPDPNKEAPATEEDNLPQPPESPEEK